METPSDSNPFDRSTDYTAKLIELLVSAREVLNEGAFDQ